MSDTPEADIPAAEAADTLDTSEEYLALRSQLPIDFADLDNEVMKMPALVQDASELAVAAMNDENACLLAYDIIKAEIGQQLRAAQERITEAAIERSLPLYEQVLEARSAYNHAKTYARLCDDLVKALRGKSTLLQKASDLIIAGYITPAATYRRRREAASETGNTSQRS
jgi:hypothetical protein